ncbi:MAG: TlyA family RNA methyltransferase [Candidatus Xenobia bacterium]
MADKKRLDLLLCERGLAPTREKAQALIMAGLVKVAGRRVDKPATPIDAGSEIEVERPLHPYVSRGGLKLEKALLTWPIPVQGAVCLDIGASTGGFTDCLLQHGAAKVYAVDVGYGQLDWKLRQDPRVISHERVNARYLDASTVHEPVAVIVIDVAFISLSLILSPAAKLLLEDGHLVALVKPQFEAGRKQVGRGGVVKDPAVHRQVLLGAVEHASGAGLSVQGLARSPLLGPRGNVEFLAWLRPLPPLLPNRVAEMVERALEPPED